MLNLSVNFLVKGKISDRDFLNIDQVLKLKHGDIFCRAIRLRKWTLNLYTPSYQKIQHVYSAEKTRHFWVKFPTPARQGFLGHGRPNACGLPVGMFKLRINRCILSGLNCQWYFRWLKLNHISIVTCLHKRVRSAINCMVSFDEGELSHPWPKGDAFLSFHAWGQRNDLPKFMWSIRRIEKEKEWHLWKVK